MNTPISSLRHLLLALLLAWVSMGLIDNAHADERPHSLQSHQWALQFEIDGADLTAFEGLVFSGKYHLSRGSALRLGIGYNYTASVTQSVNPDPADRSTESKFTEHNMQLALQFVRYLSVGSYFNPFLVAGAQYGGGWYERSQFQTQPGLTDGYVLEGQFQSLGLVLGLGVEWFATRRISFLAEYRFLIQHVWDESRQRRESPPGQTVDQVGWDSERWSVGGDSVRFGLSLYL